MIFQVTPWASVIEAATRVTAGAARDGRGAVGDVDPLAVGADRDVAGAVGVRGLHRVVVPHGAGLDADSGHGGRVDHGQADARRSVEPVPSRLTFVVEPAGIRGADDGVVGVCGVDNPQTSVGRIDVEPLLGFTANSVTLLS